MLLVGDEREQDIAVGPGACRVLGRDDECRDAGLHVTRAAAVQAVAVDARREGVGHATRGDGVEMTVERERRAAVTAAVGGEQARPLLWPDDLDGEPARLEAAREQFDRRPFPGRAGLEIRVDGVERDQLARELDDGL